MKTLLTIWTRPGDTFDYLEKNQSENLPANLDIILFVASLSLLIPMVAKKMEEIDQFGMFFFSIVTIVSSFLCTLFLKFVYVYLIWIFGKMLKGGASVFQLRIVLAYALTPFFLSLFISIILIITSIAVRDIRLIAYQNWLTNFFILIFSIRILIIGLAKFNKFSYGYALLNILLVIGLLEGLGVGLKYMIH